MTASEYYTAPSQAIFDDIRAAVTVIWDSYNLPDQEAYRAEKQAAIADIRNNGDNAWYLVAMLDHINQAKLLKMVKPETAELIHKARGY